MKKKSFLSHLRLEQEAKRRPMNRPVGDFSQVEYYPSLGSEARLVGSLGFPHLSSGKACDALLGKNRTSPIRDSEGD